MDPATWAWVGVVVGSLGPAAAFLRFRRRAPTPAAVANPDRSLRPSVLAATGLAVAVTTVASAVLDGWWPRGAWYLFAGAAVCALAALVGLRASATAEVQAAAAITKRGDRGAASAALGGATVVGLAAAGFGLLAVSLGYLVLGEWLEVDRPIPVLTALGLGAAGVALILRVSGGVLAAGHHERRVGPVADLVACAVAAPIAAMAVAIGLGDGGFTATARVFPLAVMVVGAAASIIGSVTVRRGNPVMVLRRRGYAAAAIAIAGVLVLALTMFDEADGIGHSLGFGMAAAAGAALGAALGWVAELFTSDHWRPVKRIAARSRASAGAVVLAGIADAMRAGSLMVVVVAVGMVAAHRAGEFAFSGGGVFGMAVAVVGMVSTLGTTAAGTVFAPIARAAGTPGDGATDVQREAAEALAAAGSASGAVSSAITVGAGGLTALTLLLAFRTTAGLGAVDLRDGGILLGLVVGGVVPLFAVGWAVRTGHRADDRPTWAAVGGLLVPAGVVVAAPVAIGLADPAALSGFLIGAVVAGSGLAWFLVISGGAWDNARRLIEAGAYGGAGSKAHRAVVAADTVGEPFREVAGPALMTLLVVMAVVGVAFAGAF